MLDHTWMKIAKRGEGEAASLYLSCSTMKMRIAIASLEHVHSLASMAP